DVLLEQAHERVDLFGGPLPVLLAEREQRQDLDTRVQRTLDHLANGRHSGCVSQRPRQRAPAGPAAVAVHDDGDMRGDTPVDLDPLEELVRGAHTSIISASFVAISWSICFT